MIEQIIKNYTPIGDNITLILCIVLLFLKSLTYSKNEIKLQVFIYSVNLMLFASISQLLNYILYNELKNFTIQYYLFVFFFLCLLLVLINFIKYIIISFELNNMKINILDKLIKIPTLILFSINLTFYPIAYILNNNILKQNLLNILLSIFFCIYWYCVLLLAYTIIKHKKNIIYKIWKTFTIVITISVIIILISFITLNISFISFAFLLPLITAYNLLHNNPYDIELGTLDINSFDNYLLELKDKNKDFTLVCLRLECNNISNCLKNIKLDFCLKYPKLFNKNYLFKINDHKYVLIIEDKITDKIIINNYIEKIKNILNQCAEEYNAKYKLNIIQSSKILNETKKYIRYNKYLERRNNENHIYIATNEDLKSFFKTENIKIQLKNIYNEKNLNDPRVLVYCQPIYNIKSKKYESAEALMRLDLPEIGIVYPDVFIPIAEECNYLHQLSLIILNKTCKAISDFEKKNYNLSRISVNFSISELRQPDFCSNIKKIINDNNIPINKIAIEITESKIEQDFNLIRERIKELKDIGILFYLDDFGTGYSNFERVLKLPIDIIKFDRSLLIISNQDNNYRYMIKNFSNTFNEIGYQILFEGVETDTDEEICINMNANYLQGYKYSRPIPINELEKFLT